MDNLNPEVKWRGSTYTLESVEGGKVNWFNPVSRHRDSCDIDSWKASRPYGDKYN